MSVPAAAFTARDVLLLSQPCWRNQSSLPAPRCVPSHGQIILPPVVLGDPAGCAASSHDAGIWQGRRARWRVFTPSLPALPLRVHLSHPCSCHLSPWHGPAEGTWLPFSLPCFFFGV